MELTILGAYGPYPKAEKAVSSYLITDNNTNIALDFGTGAASRILSYIKSFDNLDAVVLSHTHLDHMSDLFAIVYAGFKKPLKVYCPFAENPALDLLKTFKCFEVIKIDEGSTLDINGLKLTFRLMPHPIESYATKITNGKQTFVYSGDTLYNDNLIEFIKDTSLALLDCGRTPLNPASPHMTTEEADKIAKITGTTIIAAHLYPPYEYISPSEKVLIAEENKTYKM